MNGELVDRFLSEDSLGSSLSFFMRGSAAGTTTSSKLHHLVIEFSRYYPKPYHLRKLSFKKNCGGKVTKAGY